MNPLPYTRGWFGTARYGVGPSIVRPRLAGLRTWLGRRLAWLAEHGGPDDSWRHPAY